MKRSQSFFSLQEACKPKSSLSIPCTRSWPRLTPSVLQIKAGPGMTAKERLERDVDMDSDCGSSISSGSGNVVTDEEEEDDPSMMACFYEDEIDEADQRHGRAKKQYICSLLGEKRRTNAVVNAARKLVHARAIAEADLPSTHRILVRARVVAKPDQSVNTQRPPLQHLGWAPGTSVPSGRSNARGRVGSSRMIRIVQFAAEQGMTQSLDRLLILSDASPVSPR